MKYQPISAPCDRRYRATKDQGSRPLNMIQLFVIHVAEAPTALGVAQYFAGGNAGGSTQLVVDNSKCFRCLPNNVICEGAPGANTIGVHCEHAGYARYTKEEWLSKRHHATLSRGAYKAARLCKNHGLPVHFVDHKQMIANIGSARGITTHHEVNLYAIAKHLPGDHSHTCPGSNFPILAYMEMVKRHYAKL